MREFASAFELSNQFIDENVKPAPYIHIANKLEEAFKFTFGDAYISKGRVFSRKFCNLTNTLDYLKNLIIWERRNKDKRKDEKR